MDLKEKISARLSELEGRPGGIEEEKTIEPMNHALCKAGVYNANQQKLVTAWADLRTSAAHARWGEFTLEQVRHVHEGVSAFMAKYLILAP
jgi:hypothetical protein